MSEVSPHIYVERTSDRVSYRKCRRKWDLSSGSRQNLTQPEPILPFWTGTGFHFALEDYHAYNNYDKASDAFNAYAEACRITNPEMPLGWQEDQEMAVAMLDYYTDKWLEGRDPIETFVLDGVPQVEVFGKLKLPWEPGRYGYDEVHYRFTFDRIGIDEFDRLWIVEYKTAKKVEYRHLSTDQQTTSYCWLAQQWYDRPIAGVIYQQHRKIIPSPPKILATGRISLNKSQVTSHRLYRESLLNLYGSPDKFPEEYKEFLWYLSDTETEHRDPFVQRDIVERNPEQLEADGIHLMWEIEEKLNPDLKIFPNSQRDCGYCQFETTCVSMDDGSDWEFELEESTIERPKEDESWRSNLKSPE